MRDPGHETTAPLGDGDAEGLASAPGSTLGRFRVLGSLGAGGMGTVLAAHDPELDRKVALKLVRVDAWGSQRGEAGRELLKREAQAMARVSHSNVAAVYEVGTVGEQLFVAMELVEGQTLKGWLGERERDWRSIVAMFVAAGRGLAAVHASGLVHRDFKPDNVLVGSDGRPRVSDFGLVSLRAGRAATVEAPSDLPPNPPPDPLATLSQAGTVAYMAPEQMRGEASDARSDQFSFCVALHHALYGERPFAADADVEARRPPLARPRRRDVPPRIFDCLVRGLAPTPGERWPDMPSLLDELERDVPARRRRRLAIAALVLVPAVATVATAAAVRPRPAPCGSAEVRLAGVWDAPARARLHDLFIAAKVPSAAGTFERVSALLDRYTRGWLDMNQETCRATRVEGRQSDALMDLRFACLERHRSQLVALTDLWQTGLDGKGVRRAVDAVSALPPLDECADGKALTERAPLPRDPAKIQQIELATAHVDRARALANMGHPAEAGKEAAAARAEADATGWPDVRAHAAFVVARGLQGSLDPRMEAAFSDAAALATEAHDDRLTALALVQLCQALSSVAVQTDRALLVGKLAEGAIERAGGSEELRGKLELARAHAVETQGKYDEAMRLFRHAHDRLAAAVGENHGYTLDALSAMGRVAQAQGDWRTSLQYSREMLEREIATDGPRGPDTGTAWANLGAAYDSADDFAAAADAYKKGLAILEPEYGPASGRVGLYVGDLAIAEDRLGLFDDADAHYQRAVAILDKVMGADKPEAAGQRCNLSGLRAKQGRVAEALALAEQCRAVMIKALGDAHPYVAIGESAIGDARLAAGDRDGAAGAYERALAISAKAPGMDVQMAAELVNSLAETRCRQRRYGDGIRLYREGAAKLEKALGSERGRVARAWGGLARCLVDARQTKDGLALAARALAVAEHSGEPTMQQAAIRLTHARAWFDGGERERALVEARAAARDLSRAAPSRYDLALARSWLAAHDR